MPNHSLWTRWNFAADRAPYGVAEPLAARKALGCRLGDATAPDLVCGELTDLVSGHH